MARPKKEESTGKRILIGVRILETSFAELKAASEKTSIPVSTLLALVVDDYFYRIKANGDTLAGLLST